MESILIMNSVYYLQISIVLLMDFITQWFGIESTMFFMNTSDVLQTGKHFTIMIDTWILHFTVINEDLDSFITLR